MAKVLFGGGISDMRGKIAGTAFSRNKSGSYARQKVTGTNPSTARQTSVRTDFNNVSTAWKGLTEVQRNSFITQAPAYPATDRFGNSIQYSGQQLFMHLNAQRIAVGMALLTTCPPPVETEGVTGGLVTIDPAGPTFDLEGLSVVPAGTQMVVEATPPMGAGISNPGTKYRTIVTDAAPIAGVLDLESAYGAVFGPVASIPTGSKVFVRWFTVNDINGQTSAYNSASGIAG